MLYAINAINIIISFFIAYPKLEEEKLIFRQNSNGEKFNVKPILRAYEIIEARKVVRQVYLDEMCIRDRTRMM